jgi:hypothetical protein
MRGNGVARPSGCHRAAPGAVNEGRMRSFAIPFTIPALTTALASCIAGCIAGCMAGCMAGCIDRPLATIDIEPVGQGEVEFPVAANRNLDILFVIDDSRSMGNEQNSLASNFERLIEQIQSIEHGLPDLHIGVVSTDLGIGPHAVPGDGCTATGKMGMLQSSAPEGEICTVPTDRFIIDIQGKEGERLRNYQGTLTETFSCIARLGDQGCGYEQPLEAMRRALQFEQQSGGFLRAGARLAVIFVTDEDDCSTRDLAMFDRSRTDLGPDNGYRCFEYGVTCDQADPRALGEHSSCRPRQDSPYIYDISEYVEFLRGLKAHPDRDILVAGIIGKSIDPIVVDADSRNLPMVMQSCFDDELDQHGAFPPVRLRAFMDAFDFNREATICNPDLAGALEQIGDFIGPPPEGACMPRMLIDRDPDQAGVQPICVISEVREPDSDRHSERLIYECDDPADPGASGNLPCYTLNPAPDTCGGEDSLWIKAHYPAGEVVPPTTVIRARCERQ